jgi:hypothetical protein
MLRFLDRKSFPLFRRAWLFQERIFSPRILNFQKEELVWECFESSQCQCLYSFSPHTYGPKVTYMKAMRQGSRDDLAEHWRDIVHSYSLLQLSFAKDKLPALSGIAKLMQRRRNTNYLAGPWEDSLLVDMLWTTEHGDDLHRLTTRPATRPNQMAVP